jgi:predicted dehydrogenase
VLADSPGVRLKWLCDLDGERLERYKRRHPGCIATDDIDLPLQDDEVDAIVIATPIFTHHALAAACLDAGKHVFVEKPLASSVGEALDITRRAEEADLVLMCGHTFIYSPAVQMIKGALDSGELGDILFVSSSRVNLGLHQRDVGVVWDLGPHDFSILLHWLGEVPSGVRAVGRDSIVSGIPDVAFVSLTYASGIVASAELSWLAPSKLRRTVIVGTEKMVVYEDGAPEPVKIYDHGVVFNDPETFGEYHLSYRTGDVISPKTGSHEPLAAELADFAAAIVEGREPLANSRLATDVVRITEAADQSLARGGEEVAPDELGSPFWRSAARLLSGPRI